jgi:TetR/AcrR family transcriptional regulator, repressor for uid operon
MSLAHADDAATLTPPRDRKNLILDAAERCFVRSGFHKTTMQDLAAECGMSPGNLYRYFPSKDAVVAGIVERDRARFNRDSEMLLNAPDPFDAFIALGRHHLVSEPREKAIMIQEIWAEASRNPRVAEICATIDGTVREMMARFIVHWRASARLTGHGTPAEVADLMMVLSDGVCRRRATDPDFDPASVFRLLVPVVLNMIGADPSRLSEVTP